MKIYKQFFLLLPLWTSPSAIAQWVYEDVVATTCSDREPEVVVDQQGTIHLLYYHDNFSGGRGEIRYTSRPVGGSWSAPLVVAASGSHTTSLGVDASGSPFATYFHQDDETERLSHLNGTWMDFGPPIQSGASWKGGQGGQVTLYSTGSPAIGYFHGDSETARLAEWNGQGWSGTVVEGGSCGKGMQIARTADDRPLLAYLDQDSNETHYAERDSSSINGAWVITPVGSGDPTGLAYLTTGEVVLLRRESDSGPLHLHKMVSGAWDEDSSFPGSNYRLGRVAVDTAGVVNVAADDGQGCLDLLRSSGSQWSVIPIACGLTVGPGTGIDTLANGAAVVAYVRSETFGGTIVLATECFAPEIYCTAGASASGCQAHLSTAGVPSATAPTGFVVSANGVEGSKDGLFFFGENGKQANPWGNGASYQCVVPPVKRTGLQSGVGTVGACDGSFSFDFNAYLRANPLKDPGEGAVVQLQLWYRDPFNTSSQTTSLSNAVQFMICE